MGGPFRAIPITDTIYWVGAIDWGLRNFHGYETARGTTYNAYLILGDEIVLVDTVKPNLFDEMMDRIASVVEPGRIRHVISTHSEMDHSGALPRLLQAIGPRTVIASKKGAEALHEHFGWGPDQVRAVGTDEVLRAGNATLRFIETRMMHWPDSMFAYYEEEGVLFSNDAFGMHMATSERFADQIDPWLLRHEAGKYFANILLHLSKVVQAFLKRFPGFGLDVRMIAPDHGPIWRTPDQIRDIVQWYDEWSRQEPTDKAVVIYDTMWSSTERMARAVADGLAEGGARVSLLPLEGAHRSNVLTEILDAGALLVGSPTMNNQIYPTVADVMNYIKGLKPQNLVGACFGSYGWSGEGVTHLEALLAEMHIDLVEPGLRVKYVPTDDDLARCRALGAAVAARLPRST